MRLEVSLPSWIILVLPPEPSPRRISSGYFQVIAEPVSTCVQLILALQPRQSPRLVTKRSENGSRSGASRAAAEH